MRRVLEEIEQGEVYSDRVRLRFHEHRLGLHVVGTIDGVPVGIDTHPVIVRSPEAAETWLRARLRRS